MAISQDDIDAAALQPAEIEGEQGRVKNRPVDELLKVADRAAGIAAVTAAGSAWGCLRPARVVPPGATGPGARGE